jgi:hypothetical protein
MLFSGNRYIVPAAGPGVEHVLRRQNALHRVMGFTGKSIDDVVNCPIAKRMVLGYYKVHRQVERRSEIFELEKQWNPLG